MEFVKGPKTRSEGWIFVELPGGELRRIPKTWTSLAPVDPYQLLSSPPALRLEALRELVEWVAARKRCAGTAACAAPHDLEPDHAEST